MAIPSALANPDLGLILLLAGVLLIYAEFNRPGTVLLGCLGAFSFMLGVYTLGRLPLSTYAIGLTAAGALIVLVELRLPARNLLALTGTATLAVGLARLTPGLHAATAVFSAVVFAVVTLWLGRIALQARRNKFTPGSMPWSTYPSTARPLPPPQGRLNP